MISKASLPGDDRCSLQEITVEHITPTVWLVVDGSGSMQEPISASDSTSRWDALRSALLDPNDGVVKTLEGAARWGMLMFDGPLPDGSEPTTDPATTCPRLVVAEPELDNYTTLDQAFPAEPLGGSTPTDRALETLKEQLTPQSGPTFVVLLTDGQPNDFCSDVPAAKVKDNVIEHVKELAADDRDVVVISLAAASDDAALLQHLDEVARASDTGKPVSTPQNTAELASAIRDLVAPASICEVVVNGALIGGEECQARVQLDGTTLDCNHDDGWRMKDPTTIVLTGSACETYQQNLQSVIHVAIPCDILEH